MDNYLQKLADALKGTYNGAVDRTSGLIEGAANLTRPKVGNAIKGVYADAVDRTSGFIDEAANYRQSLAQMLDPKWQAQMKTPQSLASFDQQSKDAGMNVALTFAGPMAKTANLEKLKLAEQMRAQGVPDPQIHKETGWFFGMADGKPRFEIPDDAASINRPWPTKGQPFGDLLKQSYQDYGGQAREVGDMLSHNQLSYAYDDVLKNKLVSESGTGASYSNAGNVAIGAQVPMSEVKSKAIHELQHAIQHREGFARGGSPDQFTMPADLRKGMHSYEDMARAEKLLDRALRDSVPVSSLSPRWADDKVKAIAAQYEKQNNGLASLRQNMEQIGQIEDPMDAYRRLAGEAEARLTQSRMNMTPAQRAASYPPSMFDVPVDQQIVRFK